ncbi:hypothetical protein RB10125 [Rhodopirellula baltica SH 1]|uniref:Uncharacterized protein n=1 Tax=Rhodopirellula baltica (strain DSM 10527 / NCIMB 13988 / SH1) TaxID=243090 RepID=Q7UKI9_RHOBA|nr:hypothetical protein RB10125 [Rhodopirellula baltica SH 1]
MISLAEELFGNNFGILKSSGRARALRFLTGRLAPHR